MKNEFILNIYNQAWYNGLEEKNDVYIGNKMSIMVGMPWLRQLRIKKSKLWSEHIIFINKQVIKKDRLNLTMDNGAPNLVGKKS